MSRDGDAAFVLSSAVALREKSDAAPALASFGGRVHLAWTGTNSHLNVATLRDGPDVADKQVLPYTSAGYRQKPGTAGVSDRETVALGPALAAMTDGLAAAWTGTDGHLNWATLRGDASAEPREVGTHQHGRACDCRHGS